MRALVTGGTGRIGSAVADGLTAAGHTVIATGRRDGDIARQDVARSVVARAAAELGGLDVVVHAAGSGFRVKRIEDVDEQDWTDAWGATVLGSFFVGQAAAPHLRASRGLLVLIEDVAGSLPWANLAPHSASKAAQALLTRIFARALAPEVRVCGVAPGPVGVDPEHAAGRAARTLLGRVGTPADVSAAVLYLLTADYVTGTTITVDGGRILKTIPPGP
jgi:pteridine reductase